MASVMSSVGGTIGQALTIIIALGWALLIGIGLEPDKPLSGGIPGHIESRQGPPPERESRLGRLGEIVGWVAFCAFPLILVGVLVWIIHVH